MILEMLLTLFGGILTAITDLLFSMMPAMPDWFLTACDTTSEILDFVYQFEVWVPVDLALGILGGVLLAYGVSVVIGAVRVVVSYFTFGGGAT